MDLLTIIAIGTGLSIDAFAVSVTGGSTIRPLKFGHALRIALAFGLFQAIMPVVGWAAGVTLEVYINTFDHWIAFGLLTIIGGRMIWNARTNPEGEPSFDILRYATLLMLAIATSIDALAVGFSFAILDASIIRPILIIGLITFITSLAGVYIGNRLGRFFKRNLEVAGGVILILIGLRILWEHLFF